MKDKRGLYIIIGIVVLVIIVVIVLININSKNNNKKVVDSETALVDDKGKNNVEVSNIVFSDITRTYDSGITTIRAKMQNNTGATRNVTVKITLSDASGNVVNTLTQIVENVEPDRVKYLSTGIAGDYSKTSNIKFEVVE